jgi:hypothetical protein
MDANRLTEFRDLDYCCRFLNRSGTVEGIRLFSSPSDAAARREAIEQLRERGSSTNVELWKHDRLLDRY